MSEEEIDRKITIIFATDVVGYSKHMEKDENSTLKAYSECEQILKPLLEQKQGRVEAPSDSNRYDAGVVNALKVKAPYTLFEDTDFPTEISMTTHGDTQMTGTR